MGISTYYEYQDRKESLDSADTAIVPDEFEKQVVGMDYMVRSLRLLAEYRDEDSTRIPSRTKRLEASYMWHTRQETRFKVYSSQSWIAYTAQPAYDVTLFTVGGDVLARLSSTLNVKGRVDYRNEDDSREGQTRGLQGDIELHYRFRQVSARLGAEYTSLDRLDHEVAGTRIYLRLRRFF